jgi:hypothetical protein
MKTPVQLLIEDFKKMRENILKQDQDIKSSQVLTTLNMCITKAEEKLGEEEQVITDSYAAGIAKNSFFGHQKGHMKQAEKYFKNTFKG